MQKEKIQPGTLFIISAPSGAGKTTLVAHVIERLQKEHPIKRVITYTTKKPRPSEVHAVDYYFITQEEFEEKIAQNFFVEYSTAYGAYYGFPRCIVEEVAQGAHYIAILDRAGVAAIKAHIPEAVLIGIKPPTKESLHIRLAMRDQDSKEDIERRLALANQELEDIDTFYHHVVVNDILEVAIEELGSILIKKLQ